MKIIHGSLSALLTEVKHDEVDGVRVAAMTQSTVEGEGAALHHLDDRVGAGGLRGAVGGVATRRGPSGRTSTASE